MRRIVVAVLCACALPSIVFAQAQGARPPQPAQANRGTLELTIGGRWLLGHGVESADANLTTPGGGDFLLFSTESEMGSTPAIEVRLAQRMGRRTWVAVTGSWGFTSLDTRVIDDREVTDDATLSGSVTEFTVGGLLVVELGQQPRRGRMVPILFGGAEFVRDVHEDGSVAESGVLVHLGAGVDVHLGNFGGVNPRTKRPRALKDMALRFEGRVGLRSGGAVPDDSIHLAPGVGVHLAFRY